MRPLKLRLAALTICATPAHLANIGLVLATAATPATRKFWPGVLIGVAAILAHEAAHAAAFAAVKAKPYRIVLHANGGRCDAKNTSGMTNAQWAVVLAAGPAANLALGALIMLPYDWAKVAAAPNIMLGLLNLVPLGDLDGAGLLRVAWSALAQRGRFLGKRAAAALSALEDAR